jgi:hypothetical protein
MVNPSNRYLAGQFLLLHFVSIGKLITESIAILIASTPAGIIFIACP